MNATKSVFNSVRNFSTFAVAAAIIFSALLTLISGSENLSWQIALAIFALALGIPHGAIDNLVAIPRTSNPKFILLIVVYILMALVAVLALLNWNKLGFQLVLVMSALHFGFGDASFIAEQDRLENRTQMKFKTQSLYAISAGAIPVFIPLLKESTKSALQEINPLLINWASDYGVQIKSLIAIVAVLTLIALIREQRTREIIDLTFLSGLAIVAPPLITFAIYFGCWHAMWHTARLTLILPRSKQAALLNNPRGSFLAAVIPGLPALFGTVLVAVIIALLDSTNLDADFLWYLLVVVWALTVPHMLVTAKIDQGALKSG